MAESFALVDTDKRRQVLMFLEDRRDAEEMATELRQKGFKVVAAAVPDDMEHISSLVDPSLHRPSMLPVGPPSATTAAQDRTFRIENRCCSPSVPVVRT